MQLDKKYRLIIIKMNKYRLLAAHVHLFKKMLLLEVAQFQSLPVNIIRCASKYDQFAFLFRPLLFLEASAFQGLMAASLKKSGQGFACGLILFPACLAPGARRRGDKECLLRSGSVGPNNHHSLICFWQRELSAAFYPVFFLSVSQIHWMTVVFSGSSHSLRPGCVTCV